MYQRKLKRSGPDSCLSEKAEAKTAKLNLVKLIRTAKDDMWKRLCDEVEKDPWGRPYKMVMGKLSRPPPIPELNTPGRIDKIVRELFPQHQLSRRNKPTPICSQEAKEIAINTDELVTATKTLKKNTAPGPDGITNDVLKCFAKRQPDLLLKIYNKCLTEGHFPIIWKRARLVLLRKGDKPLDTPSSYRPLCMLDCPGKLFEKILDNRLRTFLEENNCLSQRQFGFRKGRSTTDAVHILRNIVETNSPKKKIGVMTLDIKNAFNSAPWDAILKVMQEKHIPKHLCNIIGSYLENRTLLYERDDKQTEQMLTSGVPQGSVLGPTLWNILYDNLLEKQLPEGVSFLVFADDVALVAIAKDSIALEHQLTEAGEIVRKWLHSVGMELAVQKSKATILTNTRTHNEMTINIGGEQIEAGKSIKYLGLTIDSKMNFTQHAKITATKAMIAVQKISRVLPNISLAKPRKRRIIASVTQSILLYGAPNWADSMSKKGKTELVKVQRKTAIRIASAYSTISTEASQVLADLPPIDLLAKERRTIYLAKRTNIIPNIKIEARKKLTEEWQRRWDASKKGRWTHKIIQNLDQWTTRKHGEVSYHLTQAFTGHGCFAAYLHKIGKTQTPKCWYCDHPVDDAKHTLFHCDAWHHTRTRLRHQLEVDFNPDTMLPTMPQEANNFRLQLSKEEAAGAESQVGSGGERGTQ